MKKRNLLIVLGALVFTAYIGVTLPMFALMVQSEHFRFLTINEITRKLAHVRPLKFAFIGDSLTAQYSYPGAIFGSTRFDALNLGAPSHTIKQIQSQLPNAARLNPERISILAGTNDVLQGRTDHQIIEDYNQLLIQTKKLGFKKVYVTSLPVFKDGIDDLRIAAINAEIKKLVYTIDIGGGDGNL